MNKHNNINNNKKNKNTNNNGNNDDNVRFLMTKAIAQCQKKQNRKERKKSRLNLLRNWSWTTIMDHYPRNGQMGDIDLLL